MKVLLSMSNFDAWTTSSILEVIDRSSLKVVGVIKDLDCKVDCYRLTRKIKTFLNVETDKIVEFIKENRVDLLINVGANFLIHRRILMSLKVGGINIHPSALPENRGCHHSFWGIIDRTEHGATIHWMSHAIDCGDIIDQITFEDDGISPADEIQRKEWGLMPVLLERNIRNIIGGTANRKEQGVGTYHSKTDILKASCIDSEDCINGDYLFRLIRATSCGDNGFYINTSKGKFIIKCRYEELK